MMEYTSLKIHTIRDLRLLPPAVGQPWNRSKIKAEGPTADKNQGKKTLHPLSLQDRQNVWG